MLSNKDGEVFGLRCSTRWLCRMKKGGPKAAPSPADLQRDGHRGELSWIGAHAAQSGPKVLQRDGCITMVPRINVVNYGPDSSQQKGRPKPPSRVSFDRIAYAAPATFSSAWRTDGASPWSW
jgi:hypothetical protein